MPDGYAEALDRRLAANQAAMETSRVRESAGGGDADLIDLAQDGVPVVEGVEPAKPAPALPDDDGKLLDLSGEGVPMVDAPGDGQAVLSTMREADRAKDADTAELIDLGDGVPMRESSYGGLDPETPEVYVQDQNTLPLLRDLYLCLDEQMGNGSTHLQNEQVKRMIEDVERGHSLSVVQLGAMKTLVAEHADEIKALRESGQGTSAVPPPDPATGRVVTDDDRAAGLLDLGADVPTKTVKA